MNLRASARESESMSEWLCEWYVVVKGVSRCISASWRICFVGEKPLRRVVGFFSTFLLRTTCWLDLLRGNTSLPFRLMLLLRLALPIFVVVIIIVIIIPGANRHSFIYTFNAALLIVCLSACLYVFVLAKYYILFIIKTRNIMFKITTRITIQKK